VQNLTPPYARLLLRLTRPFPDFDPPFVKPLRRRAVSLLQLKEGDRALDAGCGAGGSFPYLVDAVGASGSVVGVEISPEATVNARKRIARRGWGNVDVIEAPAQSARLSGLFDGLLMLAAPDVYGAPEALDNLLPHLKKNARIVFFGAKTSSTGSGRLLNPFVRWALSTLSFPTTPVPEPEPWRFVAPHVENLEIEERAAGSMFLASGTYRGEGSATTGG
jgi:demethylmenaquinone methyltransferase/2-methoxy-6-polyprenyl-1,4-benzoquinol methylase